MIKCIGVSTSRICFDKTLIRTLLSGMGDDVPSTLVTWISEGVDRQFRVSIGPDDSYIAWDSKRIRWENIPKGLEKVIQSWLSPTGWTSGPPRIISLGAQGAWFALSQYGSVAYSIPASLTHTHEHFTTLEEKIEKEELKWSDLEVC
jgi:hypothetical protein